jgi:uncharacterized protein YnzC (UPF0291/DUF896 family)
MSFISKKNQRLQVLRLYWINYFIKTHFMSKLETLTPEQIAQMQVFRDKYIDNFKSCKRPEKRKIKK